ncbi:hypothetical protein [Kocuria marina]|uniref:hypothetical protein n=1 Tax=Kocuria marina TaxID=223184 RepID=UPI0022E2E928|nr:hypothetical protein [Kocuria marina]
MAPQTNSIAETDYLVETPFDHQVREAYKEAVRGREAARQAAREQIARETEYYFVFVDSDGREVTWDCDQGG